MKKQKTSKDLEKKEPSKEKDKKITDEPQGNMKNKKHVSLKEFFEYLLAGYLALLPFFLILIGLMLALLIVFLLL